jgi:hypothetical protein
MKHIILSMTLPIFVIIITLITQEFIIGKTNKSKEVLINKYIFT